MKIQTQNMVSITEANQNFSKVARLVDDNSAVIILKSNKPKYVLIDYNKFHGDSEEDVETIARRILKQNVDAFRELAK